MCLALAGAAFGLTIPAPVHASDYPTRPLRMIVSFPPGGAADTIARAMRPALERRLGQPVIIENKIGAGGIIGLDAVAKAEPDGCMIGFASAGALAVSAGLGEKMPYDPLKDLAPITLVGATPFILAASPAFPVRTLDDVIAAAKAKPGGITIGHGGNGTAMFLTATLLNTTAGIELTLVPYRGTGPVIADVVGNHVALGIVDGPPAVEQIRAGRLRAIAISSLQRTPALADIPTFDEQGLMGFESIGWYGIVAPAKTPPAIVAKLNAVFVAALNEPDVAARIRSAGAEPKPMTSAEFGRFIRDEIIKWRDVAQRAGLKLN
jgi:tripartite-type tricarboxylate transporter receptor subunit TctC